VPINSEKGLNYLSRAAADNDENALWYLATTYHDGLNGLYPNWAESAKYLKQIAGSWKNRNAYATLSEMYEKGGNGLKKDARVALYFRIQSTFADNAESLYELSLAATRNSNFSVKNVRLSEFPPVSGKLSLQTVTIKMRDKLSKCGA
jgi:hypothetical protein